MARREEHARVEGAFDGAVVFDGGPRLGERSRRVHADDVLSGVAHVREQRLRPRSEMNDRHACLAHVAEDVRDVRRDVLRVVGLREIADPRVEELHALRARRDLREQVAPHDLGELPHEGVPRVRLGVREPLGLHEVRALDPLDEVARERERRAGEADERDLELLAQELDRLEHIGQSLLRVDDAERVDLRAPRDRLVDDRPLALRELEGRAHRLEGQEDVGEEDGGVHAEAERLQRHLRREVGVLADVEERVLLAKRPVLGHVPPCLAHEPHGSAVGGLTAARSQEAVDHAVS